jgi:Fic/DOC family protein
MERALSKHYNFVRPHQALANPYQILQARARRAIAGPDGALPVGRRPTTALELRAVLLLAANLHGEWVRIHPFANGNGRIARLWVIWVAARYGLPPFRGRAGHARPGGLYCLH